MPIHTDIRTETLPARFRSQRTTARKGEKRTGKSGRSVKADVRLEARISASGLRPTQGGQVLADRVEISLAANMTVEAANGIMYDSVTEQINRTLQEAGIDLKVEMGGQSGIDLSPEATARRIVDFGTSFLDAFRQNHPDQSDRAQVKGFMSLIRGAIEEGFQGARSFLEGITKLSETIDETIDRTFELANRYMDAFHQAQLDMIQPPESADVGDESAGPSSTGEAQDAPEEAT